MTVELDWQALGGVAVIMAGHVGLMKLIVDKAVDKLNIKLAEQYVTKSDCKSLRESH